MRYRVDSLCVALVLAIAAFQLAATLQAWGAWAVLPILVMVRYINLIEHNHAHLGIFRSSFLNEVFGWLCCMSAGMPLEAYRVHHVYNHHSYSQKWEAGARDWSSTFGFEGASYPDRPVARWYYTLSFPLIAWGETWLYFLRAPSSAATRRFLVSLVVVGAGALLLAVTAPYQFLMFYLGPWLVVLFGLGWANYRHHAHASTACADNDLSLLSTTLGFNIGYHDEHHQHPSRHWTELPHLHAEASALTDHSTRPVDPVAGPLENPGA